MVSLPACRGAAPKTLESPLSSGAEGVQRLLALLLFPSAGILSPLGCDCLSLGQQNTIGGAKVDAEMFL